MVLLNPLSLVFTNGDILPLHSVYYMFYMYKCNGNVGLWASNRTV